MDATWASLSSFLAVYVLAIVSPGPNFVLVTNTALGDSRSAGLFTALGVASGSGLFALAGLAGLLPLVHALPHFAEVTRFAGGGYLLWLGFDMLRGWRANSVRPGGADQPHMLPLSACRRGLMTNLTNPKAWAFYLSLFSLVLAPSFPLWGKVFLNLAMFLISLAWYASVVLLVSSPAFRPAFLGLQSCFRAGLGVLLMVFGLKVLLG